MKVCYFVVILASFRNIFRHNTHFCKINYFWFWMKHFVALCSYLYVFCELNEQRQYVTRHDKKRPKMRFATSVVPDRQSLLGLTKVVYYIRGMAGFITTTIHQSYTICLKGLLLVHLRLTTVA